MAGARRLKAQQVAEPEEADNLDQTQEQDNLLTGAVPEGLDADSFLVQLAKRQGWKDKDEWDRVPEDWTDHRAFLEGTTSQVETLRNINRDLRERNERITRAAADTLEEERRAAREEATRIIRESEDPDARFQAAQTLERNSGPHPETQAWMAKNSWFQTDPDAQALAVAAINRAAQQNLSISAQLQAGEDSVKRRFPEYFTAEKPANSGGSEQRLSDVRRSAPPAVAQGSRATQSAPRERGFADIPAKDRDVFRHAMLPKLMQRGLKKEDAEARYAASYWKSPPPPPNERGEELWPTSPVRSDVWRQRGMR